MNLPLDFHPLVQKDFNEIMAYYEGVGGTDVADRFDEEFQSAVDAIRVHPLKYPFYLRQRLLRRLVFPNFPYLVLYRVTRASVRIMVLKHVKRAPGLGLRR